jgi:RNA polymerase sigma factor (sigma-70 family)
MTKKKIDKIYQILNTEFPPIQHDKWKYVYVGDRNYFFDLNNNYDPTDDMIDAIDAKDDEEASSEDEPLYTIEELDAMSRKMLRALTKRQRYVIKSVLYENKSFAEIGRELGCTRQNVYHHYNNALRILREKFNPAKP